MNIKKIIIIVAVLLLVVLGIYFITSNKNITPTNTTPETNIVSKVSQIPVTTDESSVTVDIKNLEFNPTTLNIKTGTKVTWTNSDNTPHTVTSEFVKLFDSKTLSPGQSYSYTFSKAGFINYSCNIHPTMKGIIIIKD